MKKGNFTLEAAYDRASILRSFISYLFICVVLFLGLTAVLLYPQIRTTLGDLQTRSDIKSAETHALILHRFIEDREFGLYDIAESTYVLNAVLLGQGERPDFKDFISHAKLLREDPILTVLDINANVLFSESQTERDYSWAGPIIEGDVAHILNLVENKGQVQFELAIPVIFGLGLEGVMVAQFPADLDHIFNIRDENKALSGVIVSKNNLTLSSEISSIKDPHVETQFVEKYKVNLTHLTSRTAVNMEQRAFLIKFLILALIAAILSFAFLVIYGRHIIVRPYAALAETKEAISKAVEGIAKLDSDGRYIDVNNAYAQTIGYEPKALIGQNWSISVAPDDLSVLSEAYDEMLETGRVTVDATGIKQDGSQFYKQVTMISHYDEAGTFIGHHCFMKDISARKAAELQREKLVQKLSESNEELERFAFVCSHDLQEPLRMIRSFSELLERHLEEPLKTDAKGKKYLGFVTDAAERAQELIRDILSYSSIDSDATKLEKVDLNSLVKIIQKTLHKDDVTAAPNITWDDLPSLTGNKTQLYQLFLNLITNGLKYHETGTVAAVHISAKPVDNKWQIAIKDNGIGIEEAYFGKIFEVFQRLHRRNEYSGTGVGLSICRKIVERHGGEIWVESTLGEGSTFFFTLDENDI